MSFENPTPSERRQGLSLMRIMVIVAVASILFLLGAIVFRSCQGGSVGEDTLQPDTPSPGTTESVTVSYR
jgi:hypothetical protein